MSICCNSPEEELTRDRGGADGVPACALPRRPSSLLLPPPLRLSLRSLLFPFPRSPPPPSLPPFLSPLPPSPRSAALGRHSECSVAMNKNNSLLPPSLLPSSLLPPPSSAAVSVQGRCDSHTGASGSLAAAGLGADASRGHPPRSRPQQSEVQQVGLLPQRLQQGPERHQELEGRCQHPKGEGARKAEPTSGVGEGLEKQGGGCLASSSFRRYLRSVLEAGAGRQLEELRDRSCGGAGWTPGGWNSRGGSGGSRGHQEAAAEEAVEGSVVRRGLRQPRGVCFSRGSVFAAVPVSWPL